MLRIAISFLIMLLFAMTLSLYAQDDIDCREGDEGLLHHVEAGGRARGRGEGQLALVHYRCALAINPNSATIYKGMGLAYDLMGDTESAIEHFEVLRNLEPDNPVAYNNIGWMHYKQNQWLLAEEFLDQAILLDPAYAVAYNNRGLVHQALGNTRQAEIDFNNAIKLEYQPADIPYINLANLYVQTDELNQANEYFLLAQSINPDITNVRDIIPLELWVQLKFAELLALVRQYLPILGIVGIMLSWLLWKGIQRLRRA